MFLKQAVDKSLLTTKMGDWKFSLGKGQKTLISASREGHSGMFSIPYVGKARSFLDLLS